MKSILDPSFEYRSAAHTDVRTTWEKAGWKPTTESQKRARQLKKYAKQPRPSNVREIKRKSA